LRFSEIDESSALGLAKQKRYISPLFFPDSAAGRSGIHVFCIKNTNKNKKWMDARSVSGKRGGDNSPSPFVLSKFFAAIHCVENLPGWRSFCEDWY
jgi:hypothetical protein